MVRLSPYLATFNMESGTRRIPTFSLGLRLVLNFPEGSLVVNSIKCWPLDKINEKSWRIQHKRFFYPLQNPSIDLSPISSKYEF